MKVAAETSEASVGSVAVVEAATEAAVTSMTGIIGGCGSNRGGCDGSSGCCRWGSGGVVLLSPASVAIPSSSPASSLEYPCLLDVAAAPKAAVLQGAD